VDQRDEYLEVFDTCVDNLVRQMFLYDLTTENLAFAFPEHATEFGVPKTFQDVFIPAIYSSPKIGMGRQRGGADSACRGRTSVGKNHSAGGGGGGRGQSGRGAAGGDRHLLGRVILLVGVEGEDSPLLGGQLLAWLIRLVGVWESQLLGSQLLV
jgi:hypothetical protein